MNRIACNLLVISMVLCSTALPTRAQQSQQDILNSLNSALQTVAYATQDPSNSNNEQWNNSYQFAVIDNRLDITYRLENTYLKGEVIQDHYTETGTYSAPIDMISQTEISLSPQMTHIALDCRDEANCFIQEYSGAYEKNGKITPSGDTKSLNKIGLILPEDLIQPTIDLLQQLLYP